MKRETKNIIKNLTIINVFLIPGLLLVCADSLCLNFLGVCYLWGYWDNIGKPVYERYKEVYGEIEE